MKKVLVILADGFEEIEALTPVDLLRRAGIEVFTASLEGSKAAGSHGICVEADISLSGIDEAEAAAFDAVVIPGGMPGAANIASSSAAVSIIRRMYSDGRLVAAICASPAVVLAANRIAEGRTITCYPGFEKQLGGSYRFSERRVVADGNLITSRGPGTAAEFSLEIINYLADEKTSVKIKEATLQA